MHSYFPMILFVHHIVERLNVSEMDSKEQFPLYTQLYIVNNFANGHILK